MRDILLSHNHKNVFRGLHYQNPQPQAKIVWCLKGAIFDILLDLRSSSPTFKKWCGAKLSSANGPRGVYAPRGLAHGFLSLEEGSDVLYLMDNDHRAECERGIRCDDPELGIKLPKMGGKLVISERDRAFPDFKDALKF